jgi:hypothetical protein
MKPTSEEVINELCKILDATPKKINGFMTPQEKARELFTKFIEHTKEWDELDGYVDDEYRAKECALIAVDEVIECCKQYDELNETYVTQIDYWTEVKQEIEKL